MADEGDQRQPQLPDFLQVQLVDGWARPTGSDRIHAHVFARGEVCPNSLRFGRGQSYRRRAADTGMVAADHREDLDAAYVARLQASASGPDIRKNAALSRRYDHELEIFGTLLVDAARERRGEVHFVRSRAYGSVRIGDRLIGDVR